MSGKMDTNEAVSNIWPPKTELIDVNFDCQVEIFSHLEYEDLLNIADSNKDLRRVVGSVVQRKYKINHIAIKVCTKIDREFTSYSINDHDCTLKLILQIIRCFGNMFDEVKLAIHNSFFATEPVNQKRDINRIITYVNLFCAESLSKLFIGFYARVGRLTVFDCFEKPFINIESISFFSLHLKSVQALALKTFGPHIRRLLLRNVTFENTECTEVQFPYLEQIAFEYMSRNDLSRASFSSQHLKSLTLRNFDFSIDILKTNCGLECLEYLEVEIPSCHINKFEAKLIHFKNVKKFKLHIVNLIDSATLHFPNRGEIHKFSFTFDRLEEFSISGRPLSAEAFSNFIINHPTITKLTVDLNFIKFLVNNQLLLARKWPEIDLDEPISFLTFDECPCQFLNSLVKFECINQLRLQFVQPISRQDIYNLEEVWKYDGEHNFRECFSRRKPKQLI